MPEFDTVSYIENIKKKINNNVTDYSNTIDFISTELLKNNITINDELLTVLSENITNPYVDATTIKHDLQEKINSQSTNYYNTTTSNPNNTNSLISPYLETIQQTKNLTEINDTTLHFGNSHKNFLQRLFHMEVTQNYLSALKWYVTNELIEQQNKFNSATENSLIQLLDFITKKHHDLEVELAELKNYKQDSESWLHKDELHLEQLETKLSDETTKLQEQLQNITKKQEQSETKLTSETTKLQEQLQKQLQEQLQKQLQEQLQNITKKQEQSETKLTSETTKLQEQLQKQLQEQLQNITKKQEQFEAKLPIETTKLQKQLQEQLQNITKTHHDLEVELAELKNYKQDSESWLHKDELHLEQLETKLSDETTKLQEQINSLTLQSSSAIDELKLQNNELRESLKFDSRLLQFFLHNMQSKSSKSSKNNSIFYDIQPNDILYFLHIPKTAGTSFMNVLDDKYSYNSICFRHDWTQLLTNMPKNLTKYKLFRGHFGYGLHNLLSREPLYITMLRDPIERTISDYEQSLRTKDMGIETSFFKNTSLSDILFDKSKQWRFSNNQTKHIALDIDPNPLLNSKNSKKIDAFSRNVVDDFINPNLSEKELLAIAKKRLENFSFIGLTEKFNESLMLLCYTFGWKPIRNIPMLNTSNKRKKQTDFTLDILSKIRKLNQLDIELYSFAEEIFEKRFSLMVQDLLQNYYEPHFDNLSSMELLYTLLERHYERHYSIPKKTGKNLQYTFRESLSGVGWHSREHHAKKLFRWTGPTNETIIDLPMLDSNRLKIKINIIMTVQQSILDDLKLFVNDIPAQYQLKQKTKKSYDLIATINTTSFSNSKFLSLKLITPYTKKSNSTSKTDKRLLGIAISDISINSI